MPHDETQIIRFSALQKKLGNISRSTIDRWERAKNFPQRLILGKNSVGWRLDLIEQWLAGRSNNRQEKHYEK